MTRRFFHAKKVYKIVENHQVQNGLVGHNYRVGTLSTCYVIVLLISDWVWNWYDNSNTPKLTKELTITYGREYRQTDRKASLKKDLIYFKV